MIATAEKPALATPSLSLRRLAWHALGTTCEVQYAARTESQAAAFERAAVGWVANFEARYSRYRPDSLVSRINAAAGERWIEVDAEMQHLLDLCAHLYLFTGGVLDATALPLLQLWNYKTSHAVLPSEAQVEAARRLVGWSKVQRGPGRIFLPEPGMGLDFGGFGKEWAVDAVAEIARQHELPAALVDFGHDIRAVGLPPGRPGWHVGLENPRRPGTHDGSIALRRGEGVASSGDYLRCFEAAGRRYGHILDVRTGRPVAHGGLQATVIAPTCLMAGVLSTTAFVLGAVDGTGFIQNVLQAEGRVITAGAQAQTRNFFRYVVS